MKRWCGVSIENVFFLSVYVREHLLESIFLTKIFCLNISPKGIHFYLFFGKSRHLKVCFYVCILAWIDFRRWLNFLKGWTALQTLWVCTNYGKMNATPPVKVIEFTRDEVIKMHKPMLTTSSHKTATQLTTYSVLASLIFSLYA